MTVEEGIDKVSARVTAAAKTLADRGYTVASLMEQLKGMGFQAMVSKVFTNHQAEDAVAMVICILGNVETTKDTPVETAVTA